MTDTNTVADLVDHVVLQLVDVPDERRVEAMVHVLHEYNVLLSERFPDRGEERQAFLVAFFAQLQVRMAELATTGGSTGGTA